ARLVTFFFDMSTCISPPVPLASRSWFEGWLNVSLEDSDTKQWIIALGTYGYDWTIGEKKAELITFPEAMTRANNAKVEAAEAVAPGYNPYLYFEDGDKEQSVRFLYVVRGLQRWRSE